MDKKILVICYSFPPNKGIGGRRWAKFAKHLAEAGYAVEVICKQPEKNEKSEWTEDTLHPNIQLHHLPAKYPSLLNKVPQSFAQKVAYKLWMLFFKFFSKGTFPERTFFWKNQLIEKATQLIQQKEIKNVVVTVPPFRLGYYTSFLKIKFPSLNFILDYRDPWTDNRSFHGFLNLSPARMQYELSMETTALQRADVVITTTEQMTDWLKQKVEQKNKLFLTIPNGFDSADINVAPAEKNEFKENFRFVYAGTFYSNLQYILQPFLDALKKQEVSEAFCKTFKFEFYGEMDPSMKNLIGQYKLKTLQLHAPVPLEIMQKTIQQSNYCMLFAAPDHAFNFNTKFYEYLANRKPIVIFSKSGTVPKFLQENKLGSAVLYDTFEQDFNAFINSVKNGTLEFDDKFNTEQFSTLSHTRLLMQQLK